MSWHVPASTEKEIIVKHKENVLTGGQRFGILTVEKHEIMLRGAETMEEKRFEELDEQLEKLTETEKKFCLMRLLEWYQEELEEKLDELDVPETKNEVMERMIMKRHEVACEEMREILTWEVF